MLTHTRLKELLAYDPETGEWVWLVYRNHLAKKGSTAGTLDKDGYVIIIINRKAYKAHRLSIFYMTEKWPKEHVDHIDMNPANNKWNNIREATHSENFCNQKKYITNKSGYKGVSFHKATRKWQAAIMVNKKSFHLGIFNTAKEAYNAYCKAAAVHHGRFARIS